MLRRGHNSENTSFSCVFFVVPTQITCSSWVEVTHLKLWAQGVCTKARGENFTDGTGNLLGFS